jgi:hypothetical protein
MELNSKTARLSGLSLALSCLALAVSGIQTYLQWTNQDLPFRTNMQALQLEACSNLISKLVGFANANAEHRVLISQLDKSTAPANLAILEKSDFSRKEPTKEQIEKAIKDKSAETASLAKDLNEHIVSRLHLFSRSTRSNLAGLSDLLVPLVAEPEGTTSANHRLLFAGIEKFRGDCRLIGDGSRGEQ